MKFSLITMLLVVASYPLDANRVLAVESIKPTELRILNAAALERSEQVNHPRAEPANETMQGAALARRSSAPPYLPGWPVSMGTGANHPYGVALADVDANGTMEVLAGSTNGRFWIWGYDAVPLPGWPVTCPAAIQSKPAVGDLDLDGDLEVVFACRTSGSPVRIAAYHHDGSRVSGWPVTASEGYGPVSVSLYDLDDDGSPEILWGGYGGVHAWYADGTPLPWSPAPTQGRVATTLAIGNFLGDDAPEIASITLDPELDYRTWIYCHRADGTVPEGWPIFIPDYTSWGAPSFGDIDGNGFRELLVTSHGEHTNMWVFDALARVVPGFPATTTSTASSSSPTLADIDGDGDLEIFQTVNSLAGNFQAWDHRGQPLPGWPAPAQWNMGCSPVVANFDSDSELEAIAIDNLSPGHMYGYNPDGTDVEGFPFVADPGTSGPSSPAVADVDGDGRLDIALTGYPGVVGVWELDVPWQPSSDGWPTCYHDNWNTNQFGFTPYDQSTTAPPPLAHTGWAITVSPNPFRAGTELRLAAPALGSALVRVYDARGAVVREWGSSQIVDTEVRLTWDGSDQFGRPLPRGRYFVSWGKVTAPLTLLR